MLVDEVRVTLGFADDIIYDRQRNLGTDLRCALDGCGVDSLRCTIPDRWMIHIAIRSPLCRRVAGLADRRMAKNPEPHGIKRNA